MRTGGPRTFAGKARASRNAIKHGLAIAAFSAIDSPEIDQLAVQIAGEDADTELLEAARKVAAAHISLTRVRLIKYLTLEISSGRGSLSRALKDKNLDWFIGPNRWVANLVRAHAAVAFRIRSPLDSDCAQAQGPLAQYLKLDRYERHRRSQLRVAVMQFDQLIISKGDSKFDKTNSDSTTSSKG
jgi:hypothetical protein